MRRVLTAILAAALISPIGAAAQSLTPSISGPLAAPRTTAPPATVIDLTPWRTRWVAEAVIAGKRRKLLFDTGAGLTHLAPTVSQEAGCTPFGRITGYNMMGDKGQGPKCEAIVLEFNGQTFRPAATGLIDMGKNDPRDAELDGLLGLDAFEDRAVTLDLRRGHIVVETEASLKERTDRMTPLRLRLARELGGLALAPYVALSAKPGALWFELDSGNGGTILVSRPHAQLFGLDGAKEGPQAVALDLAGGPSIRSPFAYTPDLIIDGNLGMPFLRDWIVTLDLKTARAWVTPAVS